jgi:hypothetical protein
MFSRFLKVIYVDIPLSQKLYLLRDFSINKNLFDSIREPIYDHCHTFAEYVLSLKSQLQAFTNMISRYLPSAHLFGQYADLEGEENVHIQAQMLSFTTTCSSALECGFWSTIHEASFFFNMRRDIFIALKHFLKCL